MDKESYNDAGPNAADATPANDANRIVNIYTTSRKKYYIQLNGVHNMPKPTPDLRTSVVPLEVHKISNIQSVKEGIEKWWSIRRVQALFPSMEQLFKLETIRTPYLYGLKTRNQIQTVSGQSNVYINGSEIEVHRKTTMILPTYRYMRGDFGTSGLPCEKDMAEEEYKRIHSPHNAAYVGALANVVLSESGCIHFPEVYGTFTGIASKHSIDISDDYEDLSERPWFLQNLGHFFELKLRSFDAPSEQPKIELGENIELDAEELQPIIGGDVNVPAPVEEFDDENIDEEEESNDSTSTGYIFGVKTCTSDGYDHEDGIGFQDEDCETFAEAIFHDVPVQTTVMQKCEGTFYQLLKNNTESHKRVAWLAQIVFALAYAQRNYGLVHNDLHVNNVMYVSTSKEHLYYNVAGKQYKVPTYGYIMKIIDFDRATFSVKLTGMRDSRFFMSDQFSQEEEAGGQYNVEPFYNSKFAEVKPNASFDLVRLATSLFWDCFPKGPLHSEYQSDPLFKIVLNWTTLPDGTSILFRDLKEEDTHERYRGFHLYKAIARYCKQTAVPRTQIEKLATPYLNIGKVPAGEIITNIDP